MKLADLCRFVAIIMLFNDAKRRSVLFRVMGLTVLPCGEENRKTVGKLERRVRVRMFFSDLKCLAKKAFDLPLHVAVYRASRLLMLKMQEHLQKWQDMMRPSYSKVISQESLLTYCSIPKEIFSDSFRGTLQPVVKEYMCHRFNLLGSGWAEVLHGVACVGLNGHHYKSEGTFAVDQSGQWLKGRVNRSNLSRAKKVWGAVGPDYVPIDWQLDFKSGYRWNENTWSKAIQYGVLSGVDVKIPWEIARMQHLPHLAFAYALASSNKEGFRQPQEYQREFQNQILDFIAANPPRYGVNWACTMDVGIRVVNWLVARDLFCDAGAEFNSEFEDVFSRSVYEHGLHIINNLEWSPKLCSNHYLANIVGLIFVAAYLPNSGEVNAWLAFSVQELTAEVMNQFHADGGNFEASTSYHRLSAEMVVYATALVLGLPSEKQAVLKDYNHRLIKGQPALNPGPLPLYNHEGLDQRLPFSSEYTKRLEKMAEFTMHITRPDGYVPQIGDNDSGRFLKLQPIVESMPDDATPLDENYLDHRHLVSAINGLFGRKDFARFAGDISVDSEVIKSLAGRINLPTYCPEGPDVSPRDGEQVFDYPGFGVFVFRTPSVYLAMRCGSVGQNDRGGHSHNDQLSFELAINCQTLIVDPGTYLYTPAPEERNRFRSSDMHNVLAFPGKEPNDWLPGQKGLFLLRDKANPKVVDVSEDTFCGEHTGFGAVYSRTVKIQKAGITGRDECVADGDRCVSFHFAPGVDLSLDSNLSLITVSAAENCFILSAASGSWKIEDYRYSPSYGVVEMAQRAVYTTKANVIDWEINVVEDAVCRRIQ